MNASKVEAKVLSDTPGMPGSYMLGQGLNRSSLRKSSTAKRMKTSWMRLPMMTMTRTTMGTTAGTMGTTATTTAARMTSWGLAWELVLGLVMV